VEVEDLLIIMDMTLQVVGEVEVDSGLMFLGLFLAQTRIQKVLYN
jgi:hypothetical protein